MKSASRMMLLLVICAACFGLQMPTTTPGNLVVNANFESGMDGWSYVAEGNAVGSADRIGESSGSEGSHVLKLVASQLGKRCGIANTGGPSGINVAEGQWYIATFLARAEVQNRGIGLVFSLETPDGKKICGRTTLPEIGRGGEIGKPVQGTNWREYSVSVHAYASDPKCRLVISPIEPGTLYFDNISLVQRSSTAARGNP